MFKLLLNDKRVSRYNIYIYTWFCINKYLYSIFKSYATIPIEVFNIIKHIFISLIINDPNILHSNDQNKLTIADLFK